MIFPTTPDPNQIFLTPPELLILLKTESEPFTVPCRVSDPNVTDSVQLTAFYTETSREVVGFNEKWNVTFDPKVGFTVNATASSLKIRKLTVICSTSEKALTFKVSLEGEFS